MRKMLFFILVLIMSIFCLNSIASSQQTPAQTYDAYTSAVREGNFDKMISFLAQDLRVRAMNSPKENRQKEVQLMQMTTPSQYKITKTEIKGKTAILHLEGEVVHPPPKQVMKYGRVYMTQEKEGWKIYKNDWKPDEKDFSY